MTVTFQEWVYGVKVEPDELFKEIILDLHSDWTDNEKCRVEESCDGELLLHSLPFNIISIVFGLDIRLEHDCFTEEALIIGKLVGRVSISPYAEVTDIPISMNRLFKAKADYRDTMKTYRRDFNLASFGFPKELENLIFNYLPQSYIYNYLSSFPPDIIYVFDGCKCCH